MPEILPDHVPSPRTLLAWDGTAYRPVTIDAAGHLQIDVQTILGLEGALQSVATDRLIVRGEDQLFSYKQNLGYRISAVVSGAGGYVDAVGPGAGLIWKITNVRSVDITSPTTNHVYMGRWGGVNYSFGEDIAAFGASGNGFYHGEMWLETGQVIRVYFTGSLAGDTCEINLTGYVMTRET